MNDLKIDKKISEMIFNIYRMMKKNFDLDKEINLTMIQLHGLVFIEKNENCQLTDLAKAFSITLPSANNLVERLINLRLIEKKQDKNDQRLIRLSVNERGKNLIKKIAKKQKKCFSTLINKLSYEEKKKLLEILKKIIS